jgi:hypothetical protein
MVFPSLIFVTPYSSPKVSPSSRNWSKGLPSTRKFSWRARRMNCFSLREDSTSRGIWSSEELRRSFRKACRVPHFFYSPTTKILAESGERESYRTCVSAVLEKAVSGNITEF